MKKVDKIYLIDDDNVANFVNQYLINGLNIAKELMVFHAVSDASHDVYSSIEQINKSTVNSLVLIINAHITMIEDLLPSYLMSKLVESKEDRLLFIMLESSLSNHHRAVFQMKGALKKPITEEMLKKLWSELS